MVSARDAKSQIDDWLRLFPTVAASAVALRSALAHAVEGRLSFWDAMLLATADEAGCALVLSENMHDGMRFGNLTVRNPFAGSELSADLRELIGLD